MTSKAEEMATGRAKAAAAQMRMSLDDVKASRDVSLLLEHALRVRHLSAKFRLMQAMYALSSLLSEEADELQDGGTIAPGDAMRGTFAKDVSDLRAEVTVLAVEIERTQRIRSDAYYDGLAAVAR